MRWNAEAIAQGYTLIRSKLSEAGPDGLRGAPSRDL